MSRLITAGIITLAMIAVGMFSAIYTKSVQNEVIKCVDSAVNSAERGDMEGAVSSLETAKAEWGSSKGLLTVFLHHSLTDDAENLINRMSAELKMKDLSLFYENAVLLRARLAGMANMEIPAPGNIM